jgi:hypothetical protein
MSEFDSMPWERVGTSGERILEKRSSGFTHTGNNEGTMSETIRVRREGGEVLLEREVTIDWEYHGQIEAGFAENGKAVRVTGSDGTDELWRIEDE